MNPLRDALADYLGLRRSLGYGLRRAEKLLNQFLDYLEEHGASTITTDLAVAWARLPQDASPSMVGASAHRRAGVRRVSARPRRGARGAGHRRVAVEIPPRQPVSLHRRRDRRADRGRGRAAVSVAGGHLSN